MIIESFEVECYLGDRLVYEAQHGLRLLPR